ncbi:MAG: cobalt ECF transporter T component CbiQ [Candidatus Aenigmatarchaeota archaeon]
MFPDSIEKIDPRLRLIIGFIYSIFVAGEKNINFLKYYSILPLFLLIFVSEIKNFLKAFLLVNFFVFFCWFFLPFSIPGSEEFKIFKFSVSKEGIIYTFLITLKVNFIFITNFVLVFSSHPVRIIHALHHLRIPKRIINLLFLTQRYIPVIEKENNRIQKSMKIRCFRFRNNIHTYRTIGNLVSILILRAYFRAERIYKAMILRGFSGIFWTYYHFKWKSRDTFLSLCAIIYFLWIIILKTNH